jgi:hypothetical protein
VKSQFAEGTIDAAVNIAVPFSTPMSFIICCLFLTRVRIWMRTNSYDDCVTQPPVKKYSPLSGGEDGRGIQNPTVEFFKKI